MRVTEKGQVTIPLNVRRRLGIFPGSEVEFAFSDEDVVLRKIDRPANGDPAVQDVLDHLRNFRGTVNLGGMDVDAFYKMLRD